MRSGGIPRDMSLLLGRRQERAFERLYRRHVADVYRYALVVLRDPDDAENATRATFASAYRRLERGERPDKPSTWLLRRAHEVCRWRSLHADQHPGVEHIEDDGPREGPFDCDHAERAISRQLDSRLPRPERRLLRAHLRSCPDCVQFAKAQRTQRAALRSFEHEPLPDTLRARARTIRVGVVARGASVAATALLAVGVLAGGVDPRQWGNDATRIQPADAAPHRGERLFIPPQLAESRPTKTAKRPPGR
jgi:DNA-directed RNA polymerase specialized sigma24 family protein